MVVEEAQRKGRGPRNRCRANNASMPVSCKARQTSFNGIIEHVIKHTTITTTIVSRHTTRRCLTDYAMARCAIAGLCGKHLLVHDAHRRASTRIKHSAFNTMVGINSNSRPQSSSVGITHGQHLAAASH